MKVHSSYMSRALYYRRETIAQCVEKLTPYADKFKAIAFRGNSGALIAPCVADTMDKHIILVRKEEIEEHRSHSSHDVEGTLGVDYFIVDDLYQTGATIREIQNQIRKKEQEYIAEGFSSVKPGRCVGMYMFHECVLHIRGQDGADLFVEFP